MTVGSVLSCALAGALFFGPLPGCVATDTSASYIGDPTDPQTLYFETHMGEHPGWIPAYDALIRRYEELHPGTKINLRYQPLEGIDIWLETQFISGRGPDIINSGNAQRLGARLGMLVPMSEYLERESPYAPGVRWRDTFYPIVWRDAEDPIYGELWYVPFNFFTLRIYYNKELFRKAGIEREPKTWAEFIEDQKRLKQAGIVPYLMPNSLTNAYAGDGMARLSEMMFQDRVPDLDTVTPDGKVDGIEQNISIYEGKTRLDDPAVLAVPRLLKEWSQYWAPGFNGLDRQQAKMLFANGMGAMYSDGSWETEGIMESVTFDWGVFSTPLLTKKTSRYADGPRNDNNFNLWFAISKAAERRGRLPLAIDFLQFLTGPEAADTLSHYVSFVSALKNYPVPKKLAAFAPDTGHPWSYYPWGVASQSGTQEAGDRLTSLLQGYLDGAVTLDELVADYTPIYRSITVRELHYALQENRALVEDTERRRKKTRRRIDSLRALGATNPAARTELQDLRRLDAWLARSLAKARRQYEAVRNTLSRPPWWKRGRLAATNAE